MSYDYEFWQEFLDFFIIKNAIEFICEYNNLETSGTKGEMINRILDSIGKEITVEKVANLFPKKDLEVFSQDKNGRVSGTRAEILQSVIKIFKERKGIT